MVYILTFYLLVTCGFCSYSCQSSRMCVQMSAREVCEKYNIFTFKVLAYLFNRCL